MAKNPEPEKTVVESSEEEDSASSEEVGSDESDSETYQSQTLTQVSVAMKPSSSTPPAATLKETQPQSSKPAAASSSSSSSGEEDSGSESDSESDVQDPNVEPIVMKPVDAVASDLASPVKSAAAKRPLAEETETEPKDFKKAKKSPAAAASVAASEPESSVKKKLFQRLWSEEDEVEILKGMAEYSLKKKADPLANMDDFHDFIKKNLHVEVTRIQLSDKIRSLKRKYVNNKNRRKDGKEPTFSNPLHQKAYELSKSIWGDDIAEVEKTAKKAPAKGGKKSVVVDVNDNGHDGKKSVVVDVNDKGQSSLLGGARIYTNGDGSVEDNILRAAELMFEAGKWVDKGKEWNKLKIEEVALMHRRLELKTAQVKLVLDCIKSDDD